jgi:prolyl-tRNA editing enzyme YbaK/EbsC (Cys-tRNA(Pro) deacylase)
MDNRLLSWPLIYAAAGAHDALFPIEPDVLARVSEATLADVTSDGQ